MRNERGIITIVALGLAVVVSMMGLAAMQRAASNHHSALRHQQSVQAFYVAEAGMEYARVLLSTNPAWQDTLYVPVGNDSCRVAVDGQTVTVTGMHGEAERVLRISYMQQIEGVFQNVLEEGVATASNEDTDIEGNVQIYGNVWANGDASDVQGHIQDGEITSGPGTVEMPTFSRTYTDSIGTTYTGFEGYFRSLQPDEIYEGDLFSFPSPPSGRRLIFVDGDVDIVINPEWWIGAHQDLTIASTGSIRMYVPMNDVDDRLTLIAQEDVTLVGTGTFDQYYGVVYAGDTFQATGLVPGWISGGSFHGAVVAGNIELDGRSLWSSWRIYADGEVLDGTKGGLNKGYAPGMPFTCTFSNWREI